jgi:hypothetical protein
VAIVASTTAGLGLADWLRTRRANLPNEAGV